MARELGARGREREKSVSGERDGEGVGGWLSGARSQTHLNDDGRASMMRGPVAHQIWHHFLQVLRDPVCVCVCVCVCVQANVSVYVRV